MKYLCPLAIVVSSALATMAFSQQAPDAKYMLPGVTEYYKNAANDALSARAFALQCVDQFEAYKAKATQPTPGPDDSYYTGDD